MNKKGVKHTMAHLVEKRIITEKEFIEYKKTILNGWNIINSNPIGDMVFEKNKAICFVYCWVGGYLIQRTEG